MIKDKAVVLDTNVLVYNPRAIYDFPDSLVIIPHVVIKELDKLKNSDNSNTRAFARKASNIIDELTELNGVQDIPLPNNSLLTIECNSYNYIDTAELTNDEIIISTAVRYADVRDKCKSVVLYSNDTNVRITARVLAERLGVPLKAEAYYNPDKSLLELATGVQELYMKPDVLQELRQNKNISISLPYCNGEHLILIDETNLKNTVLAQYDAIHKKIVTVHDYKKGEPVWSNNCVTVRPKDARQNFLINDIMDTEKSLHFVLSRVAGAGKNYITTACALRLLKDGAYQRMIVIKPMVEPEGQATGFLPGEKGEKIAPWFQSFTDIMDELTCNGQSIPSEVVDKIELDVITHMRGRSIPNSIIIVDEAQNFSEEGIKTIITRSGKDSKIILIGDVSQVDNRRLDSLNNGLRIWAERARHPEYGFPNSTYILLEGNYRSDVSEWASFFYS